MKKLIGIIAFFLLFLAGKADTIGHNHVYLHDSLIGDFYEGDVIKLKVNRAVLNSTDMLLVERYFGCGGSPGADRSVLVIRDSATQQLVYRDTVHSVTRFAIPLNKLGVYDQAHPGAVFTGSFVAAGVGEARVRYWNGVRFEIRVE